MPGQSRMIPQFAIQLSEGQELPAQEESSLVCSVDDLGALLVHSLRALGNEGPAATVEPHYALAITYIPVICTNSSKAYQTFNDCEKVSQE